jgi:hypothetical protein
MVIARWVAFSKSRKKGKTHFARKADFQTYLTYAMSSDLFRNLQGQLIPWFLTLYSPEQ